MRLGKSLLAFAVLSLSACGGSSTKTDPVTTPPDTNQPRVPQPEQPAFLGFESAPVRPIAQSGDRVYVTNTSNNSVEIFTLDANDVVSHESTVPVGLEPVALALADDGKLWVVNHLSDSISVVDVDAETPYVTKTLLVGDEPQDIVFANNKAFISAAHRGQHLSHHSLQGVEGAGDPQLHTPGIGRADIWVFDVENTGSGVGGTPVKILSMFGDSPRGLAVSPDNSTVYLGVFHSGNQTTAVHEAVMCYGYEDDEYGQYPCQVMDQLSSPNGLEDGWLPGGRTAPGVNADGEYQPWTSMIVKFDPESGQWQDSKGRNFSNGVRFNLPDLDVFAIDTQELRQDKAYAGVGTTLFNLAVDPISGDVFVTNTDANNATRFEGSGEFGGSTVQGNLAQTRITHIDTQNGKVNPRHLNRHIDYATLKASAQTKQHSLSTPTQLALSQDGVHLYMAALGSNKVAKFETVQLKQDSFWDGGEDDFSPQQASRAYFDVAGGPSGLLLSEDNQQLYVYTRYDNALVTLNAATGEEYQRLVMPTPEPESFKAGRFMLYDAARSSSNGEASCASCHIFGDTDHLSWNLGNPDVSNTRNPQPFPTANLSRLGCDLVGPQDPSCQLLELINGNGDELSIASMKGPMTTQTLRGTSTHGHMHWRGDRVNGYFGNDTEQQLDEHTSFKNFIVAFEGLLGMDITMPESVDADQKSDAVVKLEQDMDKFADFMLAVALPPNPIRNLDNSLNDSASLGEDFFHGARRSDGSSEDFDFNGPEQDGVNCEGCHGVDPKQGFYGTRGEIAHGGEIQIFKVPQLRNLYTRVGMFGLPDREGFLPSHTKHHQGDQIRGFGFLHDGATDQLVNFLRGGVFDNGEKGCEPGTGAMHGCEFNQGFVGIPDEPTREGLVDYLMAFDNDIAPIVGQQITVKEHASSQIEDRVTLLIDRAKAPFTSKILGGEVTECDLVVQGVVAGEARGYLLLADSGMFLADKQAEPQLTATALFELAQQSGNALTYTCVLPKRGWVTAIDRDLDGIYNGDE